ncbi:LLM class flavin-dependent oxidoreductase [Cellulomonas rhizosphaerae]|uniref:LLM class flavin-dependent oxidoreductase n=1 Tax=Cellulomonas rhizosphaerae TaxID=2293719 RepID=A0A413RRC7_9CELL|nr:LLM class flavin-dependent oxidoreductase [Cellulomonas rhizosphaerae]RHA44461.1 LLM class flavin-dependent oxidoreductase [Cellulomonas rhizosphaerae]
MSGTRPKDDAVGVVLPRDLPAGRVLAYARRAEELGFDELWVVEDLGFRGGTAQAAAVLAVTSRIRVGVGILPTAARNVAFAAMEIASLAELFPGRVDVGVGHGMPHWMRSVGAWPASPLTLLDEYVSTLRALLRGERVTIEGRYVQLSGVELETRPDVVPPILTGVRGPRSLAVSGAVADGTILAEPVTPEYVASTLGHVAADGPHRLVGYNVAAVGDDPDATFATARAGLEWIGEPDWAPHITPLPFADELAALRASSASREEFVAAMPDEWVSTLAVVGPAATARARIDELHAAGLASVVLVPVGSDPFAALSSLATVLRG